jgi:Xaa-Pro aminopeptidase
MGEMFVGYDAEIQRSEHPSCKACRMARRLQPGMVVSVEPGIYFIPALIDKWRAEGTCKEFINFDVLDGYKDFGGIRLEDDMLITDDGNRMLGTRLPITVEEVEAALRK